MNQAPRPPGPHGPETPPQKETFNNKVQIYRFIDSISLTNSNPLYINSGSLVTKHLVTKFKDRLNIKKFKLNIIKKFKPTINSGYVVSV